VRRDRERDAESARMNVDKTIRAEEMLGTSQATETGQGLAQVGFDRWRLNWAETDYDKQERLFEAGINPQSRVEQAQRVVGSREYDLGRSEKDVDYLKATHDSDRAQLGADLDAARYEANLAQTRIDEAIFSAKRRAQRSADRLADMEKQLAGGEIRAPKAGLVVLGTTWDDSAGGRRKLREGDRVWPGMRIATITNLSDVQVTVPVEDTVISQVKIGQETVIRAVGNEEREFTGRVASVGPMARRMMRWESANARADQRVFDVVVTINRPDLKLLRPGTKVQIQFVRARLQHIVSVPLAAVFDKPGGRVVYVERGGRFTPRRVEIGERNDQAVEIRRGIRAGERIAISDPTLWEMP
jgi:RND family efflux transporter MFP subunit